MSCAGGLNFKNFEKEFKEIKDISFLNDEIKARNIFFKKGVFVTYGQNVFVEAETIYFDDTVIETFPEGKRAGIGFKGRDGGVIEFKAKKIVGKLHVILRGENGGQGLKARNLEAYEGMGRKGRDGKASRYSCSRMRGERECHCILVRHGEDGGRGKRGLQGGSGFRGGDAGVFLIRAKEMSEFELSYKSVAGGGGKGGFGGKGGRGGKGGKSDHSKFCHAYEGKHGKQGLRGLTGEKGEKGQEGLFKIRKKFYQ